MFGSAKNKLKKITKLSQASIAETVLSNPGLQQQIIDYNQSQLYDKGIDSKGDTTGEYSPYTIQQKIEKGQPYDHITLKDTGEMYDSMKVKVYTFGDNATFTVTADMKKPDNDLEQQWPDALGLTDDSRKEILPLAKELFLEEIKKQIAG